MNTTPRKDSLADVLADMPAKVAEQLLAALKDRTAPPTSGGSAHSLARVNGWGSAGQRPACQGAKAPAARARIFRVAGQPQKGLGSSLRVTSPAVAGGGVEA